MKRNFQTVTIETPEHFELHFRLAGIGVRFLAFLVDRLIQAGIILGLAIIVTLLFFMMGKIADVTDFFVRMSKFMGQWIIALAILVYGVVVIGYFILFEYLWSGSTPGKKSQEIRVIRKDGRPITFLDATVRNVLRFVDLLADVYPMGLLVMFLDSKNRRLGDMAAGTLVVMEKTSADPFAAARSTGTGITDPEIRDAVAALTPEDYQLISKFLTRRKELDADHRAKLAHDIVHSVLDKAAISVTASSDPEGILEKMEVLYMERTRIF
ncbi:MAG TPA: RDD family protein [Desulfomonilaceae bacterium]|nr:RDD family protein [Desulfomonilaceae bacterium]